jgi:hypothetical protein
MAWTISRGCPRSHDDIDLEANQFGGDVGQAAVVVDLGAVLEGDALALDPAPLAQALPERLEERRRFDRTDPQKPDARRLRRLSLRHERRGEDADDKGGCERNASDLHAAAVCWLSTAAIFRQPSILRNLICPLATRLKSRTNAASSFGNEPCVFTRRRNSS